MKDTVQCRPSNARPEPTEPTPPHSPGCPSPTDSEVKRNLSSEVDSTTPPWPSGEAGFEEEEAPLAAWAGISLLWDIPMAASNVMLVWFFMQFKKDKLDNLDI